ncbi:MAG: efflux RND transporter periplasmic adaptor subunit [Gammaproteobacteria bacterium]|nr:efflux RND transporter periplasmic adaptor subunit [Gammaproteobacteria bacterium]
MRLISLAVLISTLLACSPPPEEGDDPVRGMIGFRVGEATDAIRRRFPSMIRPHDETRLAFEVAGRVGAVELEEGQKVRRDQVLLALQPETFELHVQEAQAGLAQAQAAHANARTTLARQEELWERRVIPRSVLDDARTALETTQARLEQARKRLEIAEDRLDKTRLRAPFDGIISRIRIDPFATVAAGEPLVTVYAGETFEARFMVPASLIDRLETGHPVRIVLPETSGAGFDGRITELGARADAISAFPAVAVIEDSTAGVRAGMAAEVVVEISLESGISGFRIPLSCFEFETATRLADETTRARVFVHDPDTGTVQPRTVTIAEVRENTVVVTEGLAAGEVIAAAGVTYLRPGQRVRLIERY